MSLLFNMLSRLAIALLPRSKHLLISGLWSPSAVILEPKKMKSVAVSIIASSICHEVMATDAMILVFWMLSFKPTFSLSSFTFYSWCCHAKSAKSLQSCLTLCDPRDGSPPGSPIPGVLQARTMEWVAIAFSNAWKWKVKVKSLSRVRLLATPWTAAHQVPPSTGFSRQEHWSGVSLPSPMLP